MHDATLEGPRLISVVGIDGSGKTTLSKRLTERLTAAGADASYVWCRFESLALARALGWYHALFSRNGRGEGHPSHRRRKERLFQLPVLGGLYESFVLSSYKRQVRRLVARPLAQGRVLVSDRYVFDTVVDLALDRGHDTAASLELIGELLAWAPRPDHVLYVACPPKVALARKDDVPDLDYVARRHVVYEELAQVLGWHRIDGTASPAEVARQALAAIAPPEVPA